MQTQKTQHTIRGVFLCLIMAITKAKIACDNVDLEWGDFIPDLACCQSALSFSSNGNRLCQFTSACNIHDVCCADPSRHPGYKPKA